jgi:membrane fusion protein, heavy metal efflux system
MNSDSRVTLRWPAVIAAAVALLALGAGIAYLVMRSAGRPTVGMVGQPVASGGPAGAKAAPPPAGPPTTAGALPDVAVTLTPEAVERAGIRRAQVTAGSGGSTLRLPGVIEANAYKQVVVTPLVAGRVTRVLAELGQRVRRGQRIAEIFSPELSEAETRYVSARAELDAHERELQRTERLVEIGAASRQELERLHAEHTSKLTSVESARSRLELLGLSESVIVGLAPGKDVGAVIAVPAPITGVVTERMANPGVNVDSTSKMFTVVDLSTMWVVADVYEKDFSRMHVGSTARVTTKAYPDVVLPGRVSYIDPQMDPTTRTAKVRIEVANPREQLRLGMFADVSIEGAQHISIARIPRTAVQNVDNRTVVYLADPRQAGRFIEREVHLGDSTGSDVEVVSGLEQGDTVVSDGSFFVRAERERLGLRPARVSQSGGIAPAQMPERAEANVQEAKVLVTEKGYEPDQITLRAGKAARITFVRTTDKTCGTEVVFPSLNIRQALPLNQPVVIEVPPRAAGDLTFVCGMNMLRGNVVVR